MFSAPKVAKMMENIFFIQNMSFLEKNYSFFENFGFDKFWRVVEVSQKFASSKNSKIVGQGVLKQGVFLYF